jgi:hypothetical protein
MQCLGLLCVPRLLPPFGFGSVTVFDPALSRASPSQRPACGTTAQASSYSPLPPRNEGHQARSPWERVSRFIAQKPCPGETASLAPAVEPLRGYPETMLGKTVYLLDSERLSPQQRSALLW